MANDDHIQKAQRVGEIRAIFKERYKLLAALFPEHGDTLVARACAVACAHVNSPALSRANPIAVAERVIGAHHLGVEIGDQAYLVPFKGDVQLIIGPRGLIALAYRSGFVKKLYASAVFKADVDAGMFHYNLATGEVMHEKAPRGRRTGGRPEELIQYAYSVGETTMGGTIAEVLTAEDIGFYRSFSKATSGPWFDNFEGMCRKTTIKRWMEFVPRSPLMAAALRETSEGGYEIPDEMWEMAKQRSGGQVSEQVPEHVPAAAREPNGHTGHQARDPGQEG